MKSLYLYECSPKIWVIFLVHFCLGIAEVFPISLLNNSLAQNIVINSLVSLSEFIHKQMQVLIFYPPTTSIQQ